MMSPDHALGLSWSFGCASLACYDFGSRDGAYAVGYFSSPFSANLLERGAPLDVVTIEMPQARELYGRDLTLIRPDQHVAWRGDALPSDPAELLARVTGS
jgi:hypothetical protein